MVASPASFHASAETMIVWPACMIISAAAVRSTSGKRSSSWLVLERRRIIERLLPLGRW